MPPRLITAGSVRDHTGVRGDAVLVDGPRIVAVGRSADLRSAGVAEVPLPGKVLVPGLRDAHLHPVGLASLLQRPSLKPAADHAGIADILRDAARDLAPGAALTALRLDDESLAEGNLPDRDFIDRVVSDRPVLLIRYCGHVAVANSAALALAGIDATTPDPRGGSIDRDSSGRPTGVVRETAVEPVAAALRALSPRVTADDLIAVATGMASVGLT